MDIREMVKGSKSKYEVSIISDGKRVVLGIVDVEVQQVDYNNEKYILIYDSNRRVIRDAYKYINLHLKDSSINTRTLTATALVKLYSFLEIYGFKIDNLEKNEMEVLKTFLYGNSKTGLLIDTMLVKSREAKTINKYISIYRGYFKYIGIDNKWINEKVKSSKTLSRDSFGDIGDSYKASERVSKAKKVPKYISEKQFDAILKCIRKHYGIREELLVRLMYQKGLRIGEALGLTIEDIKDDCIIIRNRISDGEDQHAKCLYQPISEQDYKGSKCLSLDFGFNIVKIDSELHELLERYIYMYHEKMVKRKRTSYRKYCKADRVEGNNFLEGDNYYLFINRESRPLRRTNWNKYLKKIYLMCNIEIDKEKKSKLLNHRLRHGCAMKGLKDGKSLEEIMKILRHSSLMSVMVYINPTDEDEYEANESIWDSRGIELNDID
ncbi:tyrosine-type recombinase/integrase [Clostridium chromiireducens]|nr:site-specific integrase [Clostridium chromiireducens]